MDNKLRKRLKKMLKGLTKKKLDKYIDFLLSLEAQETTSKK